MIAGMVSGCRKENKIEEEVLTLHIQGIGVSNSVAIKRISEALSEVSEEEYGFRVEISLAPFNEYQTSLREELINGEPIDVFCYAGSSGLMSLIDEHYVYPLDDTLKEYSAIKRFIPREYWQCVTVDNKIYAIPANNNLNYSIGFVARADIAEQLGINSSKMDSLGQLHQILRYVKDKYPDMNPVVSSFGQIIQSFGEDPLGDSLGVLMNNEGTKVENLYASEQYATMCNMMHRWHEEGLISYNMSMDEISAPNMLLAYNGFGYFVNLNNSNFVSAVQGTEQNMVYFKLGEPIANTSSVNIGWCINSNSKHKEEAMQLLELLYTNQAASDICIYGQEAIDYVRIDRDYVTNIDKRPEDQWDTISWAWPNQQIASEWKLNGNKVETLPEKGAKRSKAMGFMFNSASVQEEVNYCILVVNKYNNALLSGYLNPQEALPAFLKELEDAGINTVITEKQRQLDRWLELKNN